MVRPPSAAHSEPPVDLDADDDAPMDPGWEDAWEAELGRRIADVREGRVRLVPWEETQARARAILEAARAQRG